MVNTHAPSTRDKSRWFVLLEVVKCKCIWRAWRFWISYEYLKWFALRDLLRKLLPGLELEARVCMRAKQCQWGGRGGEYPIWVVTIGPFQDYSTRDCELNCFSCFRVVLICSEEGPTPVFSITVITFNQRLYFSAHNLTAIYLSTQVTSSHVIVLCMDSWNSWRNQSR